MGGTGVALIGAGYWGRRLARVLAAADDCELLAVCDLDLTRAHETACTYGGAPTTSLTTALANDAVQAVVVATPSATHAALVAALLDAGRHVLVEKPLASSSDDAARLGAQADARGLVVMCDQTYRFAPAVASLRDVVSDPMFGTVRLVESTRTNQGHEQPDVDVFWDLAYHDLAILDTVLPSGLRGAFSVRASMCDVARRGRAHRGEVTLDRPDGSRVRITVDWHAASKVRAMRFLNSHHEVTWDDADGPHVLHDGVAVVVDDREPLALVVAEFLSAITERRPTPCGPVHELRILTLLEAATDSAARESASIVVEVQ